MQLFRRRLWNIQINGQYEKLEVINELTICFVCPDLIKDDIFAIPFTFWLDLFHNLSMHSSKISLLAHVCVPYFISRTIPHRTFPRQTFSWRTVPRRHFHKGQFPDRQFPERTIPQMDISPTDSSPNDFSQNGQFPESHLFLFIWIFIYHRHTKIAGANEFQQKTYRIILTVN